MIGVVGCGLWGRNVVRTFYELKALSAVWDQEPDCCGKLAHQYNVEACPWDKILSDPKIRGVAICVPADGHAVLIEQALKAGKHVFVEKPTTLCLQQARSLVSLAKEKQLVLMTGHILHYHPAYCALQEHLHKVGDIQLIDTIRCGWGRVSVKERNVIWNLLVHDVSAVLGLPGCQEVVSVQAQGGGILTSADWVCVQLRFASKVIARLQASWVLPTKQQRMTILGKEGTFVLDDCAQEGKELLFQPQSVFAMTVPEAAEYFISYETISPLYKECQVFMNHVLNGTTVKTNGTEALRTLSILEDIESNLTH